MKCFESLLTKERLLSQECTTNLNLLVADRFVAVSVGLADTYVDELL